MTDARTSFGPLVGADETLDHQIIDTFATVSQSDRSWTEKICAMAVRQRRLALARVRPRQVPEPRRDGRLRRRVARHRAVDGPRQPRARRRRRHRRRRPARVRDARADAPHPVRARSQRRRSPVSFEWIFEGAVPAVLENHEVHRARRSPRRRRHRALPPHRHRARLGRASNGERTEFADDDVGLDPRSLVGGPLHGGRAGDRRRARARPGRRRDDGHLVADPADAARRHALRRCTPTTSGTASATGNASSSRAGSSTPTGAASPTPRSFPSSRSTRDNRRLRGGVLHATMDDGTERVRRGHRASRPPASTSAPACTSGSTATGTASGAARCTSTASTSRTAPSRPRRGACTSCATAWCGSTTRRAAASGWATSRAWCSAPTPSWA